MLSVCLIVKNEEKFLPDCLASFSPVADEIVIVDTGSTDKTIAIAKQYGAKIFHFSWRDDFSAARNFALSQARGDWVLMPDADDNLSPEDYEKIKKCLTEKNIWGYRIPILNYSDESYQHNWHACSDKTRAREFSGYLLTKIVKLFQKRPEIKYQFSVHEGVEFSIREYHGVIKDAPFVLHHYGSLRGRTTKNEKHEYYFSLLQKDCINYSSHPKPFYELGIVYFDKQEYDKAEGAFQKVIEKDETYLTPYYYLAAIAFHRKKVEETRDLLKKQLALREHAESFFLLGNCMLKLGNKTSACNALQKAILSNPQSIRYYKALIKFYGEQQQYFPALALLYDAVANTGAFREQCMQLEKNIITQAQYRLRDGPDEQAFFWLATIAMYKKDKEKVLALCRQGLESFPQSTLLQTVIQKVT